VDGRFAAVGVEKDLFISALPEGEQDLQPYKMT
jgi:hypothetical protein